MNSEITILALTAASVGFVHTLFGPDHYLPFIVLAKSRKWSYRKTGIITLACGLGHVGSSIVLGLIGVAFGLGIHKLENVEAGRGGLVGWLFIAFGLVYFIWGVRQAVLNKPHSHIHLHEDGESHKHFHEHVTGHTHTHGNKKIPKMTPWILFIIFVLGPCEPLIPILMYPAAEVNISGLILVTSVFAITTILTMLAVVFITLRGINFIPLGKAERYTHLVAGAMILLSGAAMQFLGL